MAGGKETPRQKLISMMYLVLTALLALQVSSAIIEKFIFLDERLMHSVGEAIKINNHTEGRIKKAVADNGGKADDQAVLKAAQEIRKETGLILAYIDQLRLKLVEVSGGQDPVTKEYKGAKEEEKIAIYMRGAAVGKGEGYVLKDKLNAYTAKLGQLTGDKELAKPIAVDGDKDPMFMNKGDQKRKDFVELNFVHTPMVAALAVLAVKEAEILKLEAEALDDMAQKVGASNIQFDNVFGMYRLKSETVAAGMYLEGEMFIAASSSQLKPTMKLSGAALQVEPNGRGKIKMRASGGGFDKDGFAKRKIKGEITIKNKGKDTTFILDVEYIVAKPVVDIQSASVAALYSNCGNQLKVTSPTLGANFKPTFGGTTGAQIIPSGKPGEIVVLPTSSKVTLSISSDGVKLDDKVFAVRAAPKAEIILYQGAKPLDIKNGGSCPSRIIVKAECSDDYFKNNLPKDAKYAPASYKVKLIGIAGLKMQKDYFSEVCDLSAFAAQAKKGDRVQVEVIKVTRTTYTGGKVEASFTGSTINYGITQ
jgi:gliding motility-associated protein GldM